MASDAIVAIQDMGAAGLTTSAVEMASKGGVGFALDLDKVPQREENMLPYEMMLSESQERMLMVLKPGEEDFAQAIFKKWDLDFAVIGTITDTGNLTLTFGGEVAADIPINSLVDDAPEYERPWVKPDPPKALGDVAEPNDLNEVLLKLIGGPNLSSRAWIWEQYDHTVMADTLGGGRPGGDAAVVRVHGTKKALAITTDCTPRYVQADPYEGGKQAVAETYRNISAVGARPLAITDCLNFGNPEKPEIMGQFALACQGMAEACEALDYPVVSGNVSLYNETNGVAIKPTPAVGGVGLMQNHELMATASFKRTGDVIILIGESFGHLGASIFAKEILGVEAGEPPLVSLGQTKKHSDFVRSLIEEGLVDSCHDLSDGGLAVALAEMCIQGQTGASISDLSGDIPFHKWLFGEDQSRFIIAIPEQHSDVLIETAIESGIPTQKLGIVGGINLVIGGKIKILATELKSAHESWFKNYVSAVD